MINTGFDLVKKTERRNTIDQESSHTVNFNEPAKESSSMAQDDSLKSHQQSITDLWVASNGSVKERKKGILRVPSNNDLNVVKDTDCFINQGRSDKLSKMKAKET